MPEPFRLYLLGGFRLERDGIEVRLPAQKSKALLAYLALHPQEHPREHLAALFWGDSTDEQARGSLRVALNTLRKGIHPDLILTDRETAQLNPAFALWVDAKEIGDWRLETGEERFLAPLEMTSLQSLAFLYRGELLAGFYDEWIEPEREKYRAQYLDLLLRVVQEYRGASDYTNAIVYARKILETDRAHEPAHQHLIFLYAAQGDRTAALKQFEECAAALNEELGVEPSAETIALAKKINQKPQAKSDAAAQTNLPKPFTSFVGRERELEEIRALLGRGETFSETNAPRITAAHENASSLRALTLTGPGGSGKTRLAIQVGRGLLDSFSGGVWWVELAPLSDPLLVPQAVAKALGVPEEPHTPLVETLNNFLRARELLLILDNCEHLIDACALLVQSLLSNSPVSILATSRESLNIAGEQLYPVAPLDVPRAALAAFAAQALEYSAVRLFVERARLADPRFELNESNVLPIVQICTRLDGIPLAIELAAARVKQLSVSEIAARLDSRFELLVGTRTASPRQQTLRALIDWSYNLLDENEKSLFQQLAVFAGGWTLEAMEAVAKDNGGRIKKESSHSLSFFPQLASLVSKSLVVADTGAGETRYHLLETIREYAREKLAQAGAETDTRKKHLAYFVQLAEDAAARMWGRESLSTLEQLERDHDNLRAALRFAWETGDMPGVVALAGALGFFWQLRNHLDEAESWFAKILEQNLAGISPRLRGPLYSSAGTIAWRKHDYARAEQLHRRALQEYELVQDAHGIAFSQNNLGIVASQMGRTEQSLEFLTQALSTARAHNDAQVIVYALNSIALLTLEPDSFQEIERLYGEAWRLAQRDGDAFSLAALGTNLAELMRNQGDYTRALSYVREALASARQVGEFSMLHMLVREHGSILALLGRFDEANAALREALMLAQKQRDAWAMGGAFSRWAWYEALRGNPARAARLLGYTEMRLEQFVGAQLSPPQTVKLNQVVAELRETLGEERFRDEWARGRVMSEADALAFALVGENT
jgi:non-specific serine/threonine protein kinase